MAGAFVGLLGFIWVGAFVIGLLLYFPFHFWLTISLFLVLFSRHERARLLGDGWSFFGAFFGRIFSPFGVMCIGCFYTLMFFLWVIGVPG